MPMNMNKAETIKNAVTALDACQRYGIQVSRTGYANCLWHTEKTPSLKVYEGNKGFHCFGCGKSGSVIDLVMQVFGLNFLDACKRIDQDFGLHLYDDDDHPQIRKKKTQGQVLAEARAEYDRRKAQRQHAMRLEALETAYNEAEVELINLTRQIVRRGNTGLIERNLAYDSRLDAKIQLARYNADQAEAELYEFLGIGGIGIDKKA